MTDRILTLKELEEAEALEKKATLGPWHHFCRERITEIQLNSRAVVAWPGFDSSDFPEDADRNAAFIVHARTFVPRANATLRRLWPLVEALAKMPCPTTSGRFVTDSFEGPRYDCDFCLHCQARQAVKEGQ